MKNVTLFSLALVLASAGPGTAHAQTAKAAATPHSSAAMKAAHTALNSNDMVWGDAPPSLPPGAKLAVLFGDPSKTGPFIVRIKANDGYKIPLHWHPTDEQVTVISGSFIVSVGDDPDPSKALSLSPGAFASMPAKMHHAGVFGGDSEIQVSGMGPFKIIYVNASDNPNPNPAAKPKSAPKKADAGKPAK